MDWLAQNWVLVFVAFIGMHMFGHGCHGGHGCRHDEEDQRPTAGEEPNKDRPQGHQH
ncbi:DUF2933 domain-containing protein [Methylophaga pinxianii]|uniref:DUF2933 domain-containing protein n=1 Tax=Methylophaga pinxianii TaxID=2881052 RepID=UPI001CF53AC9|nr:DUF2933 domain-containing protein [Methylophaga pinxianii]MCB2426234.1 DUF2933 domain-containing protein [Methylophaga pinxianii]UPH47267.1 DUF2933 domain-containing protein [Methylophaga pinxianii]